MSRMSLSAVKRGVIQAPTRVVLYGVEGIGKSTFGANAPEPIFLGAEDGTSQLDVSRFAEPRTWEDVLAAIGTLSTETHEYRTLVVDTLDWIEPLVWAHVCAQGGKKSIEDYGYGKGYVAAGDEWRVFLARLDALREARKMNVILLAHSWIKPFKDPDSDGFDRYEMKLHKTAAGKVKEWADAVLFARYETYAVAKEGRTRGVSTGARVIHTEYRAAWDAKNRYHLPEVISLDWAAYAQGMKAGDPAVIRGEIEEAAKDVDEGTRANVATWLKKTLSVSDLRIGLNKIHARISEQSKKSA